jgi:predicted CoA-binding protein
MEQKKTLIIGASENPERYGNMALLRLRSKGHPVVAIGKRKGKVADVEIQTESRDWKDIDTVTLYLNPQNQKPYYDYIIGLNPARIIFNPGTENPELQSLAEKKGIETIEACTLVMLSVGNY